MDRADVLADENIEILNLLKERRENKEKSHKRSFSRIILSSNKEEKKEKKDKEKERKQKEKKHDKDKRTDKDKDKEKDKDKDKDKEKQRGVKIDSSIEDKEEETTSQSKIRGLPFFKRRSNTVGKSNSYLSGGKKSTNVKHLDFSSLNSAPPTFSTSYSSGALSDRSARNLLVSSKEEKPSEFKDRFTKTRIEERRKSLIDPKSEINYTPTHTSFLNKQSSTEQSIIYTVRSERTKKVSERMLSLASPRGKRNSVYKDPNYIEHNNSAEQEPGTPPPDESLPLWYKKFQEKVSDSSPQLRSPFGSPVLGLKNSGGSKEQLESPIRKSSGASSNGDSATETNSQEGTCLSRSNDGNSEECPSPMTQRNPRFLSLTSESSGSIIQAAAVDFQWTGKRDTDPSKEFDLMEIGRGSYGKVYRAKHKESGFVLCVKAMKGIGETGARAKIVANEIEILKQCRHEAIVSYYASCQYKDTVWIMMEYCEGGSVQRITDFMALRQQRPSEAQIKYILYTVVTGLHYLHSQDIAHRDLKLDNLLITARGKIKIGDFGTSKTADRPSKKEDNSTGVFGFSTIAGTMNYLSPEILLGAGYGIKVDIYSLGMVTVTLAELKHPYDGMPLLKLMDEIANGPKPTVTNGLYSADFDDVIDLCLNKNPKDRPSAADLLQHRFFNGQPGETEEEILLEKKRMEDERKKGEREFILMVKSCYLFGKKKRETVDK
eukprot:TRINITY_DN247_c4_g1_i1.p1 TRINITY_DN247_c4_g1~~TRINITY_DN247_c4_g1_i1.p1  ORF type:complete len:717 (-),score=144.95 TRINITY_DN247_c4_g1_i1:121-2271(-)